MSVYNLPLAAMNSGYGTSALPTVSDPDKAYADLLEQQYQYFQDNFAPRTTVNRPCYERYVFD